MTLTRVEQEVTINFNAEEDTAIVDTRNPVWIRKMDKLLEENPDEVRLIDENEVGKTYEVPKGAIRISIRKKRVLTEEQRKSLSERMKNIRAK